VPAKILVVDDEAKIVEMVRLYLERDGHRVLVAGDGPSALEAFRRDRPDLVVLDIMLPGIDGLEVCRTIRRESEAPIVMLTARAEEVDKLVGLELGADDYLTKPFSPRELAARVRAVLRRSAPKPAAEPERLEIGSLVIDVRRHEVSCDGERLALTPTEFRLLWVLAREPGRVFTRAQLLDLALDESYEAYERTVDAHIKNLRQKLRRQHGLRRCGIATVHGVGYKFLEKTDA
jgi:DNA-binding response OmpR family regulator